MDALLRKRKKSHVTSSLPKALKEDKFLSNPNTIGGLSIILLILVFSLGYATITPSKKLQDTLTFPSINGGSEYDHIGILLTAYPNTIQDFKRVGILNSENSFPSTNNANHRLIFQLIQGLRQMKSKHQNLNWYIFTTPYTLLFSENINQFLSRQDPNSATAYLNFNVSNQETNEFSTCVIFSKESVSKIIDQQVKFVSCVENIQDSVDNILTKCLTDFDIEKNVDFNIHSIDPLKLSSWPYSPCDRPLAISSVSGRTNSDLLNKKNATYHELFALFKAKGLDQLRKGPYFITSKSSESCQNECDASGDCLSWGFYENTCYLNGDIPKAETVSGAVSKVCYPRYVCGQRASVPCESIRSESRSQGTKPKRDRWL